MIVFLMALWVPLAAFCGTIIEVSSIDTIQNTLESATPSDLIVFDVDNTLLVPHDKVLRPCGEEFFLRQFSQLSTTMTKDQMNTLLSGILLNRTCRPVDAQMPPYIRDLQAKGLKVIALTAFTPGRYGAIHCVEDWRYKELLALGYNFSNTFPHTNHIVFGDLMKEDSLPIYKDGILYSARHTKGEILVAFFRRVKWQPRKVIFIDDKKEYVDSVHEALTASGIECTCFHYRNAEMAADVLDETHAMRQFNHFRSHGVWLGDIGP